MELQNTNKYKKKKKKYDKSKLWNSGDRMKTSLEEERQKRVELKELGKKADKV